MRKIVTRRSVMLSALGLSLLAAGCGGGGGNSGSTPPATFPALDRSSTVAGTTSGSSGIRDDITAIIDQYPLTTLQKEAFKSVARSLQSALLNSATKEAAIAQAQALFTAISAFHNTSVDTPYYIHRLTAYTLNTPQRTTAYIAYLAKLGGVTLRPTFAATRSRVASDACASSGYECGFINGVLNTDMDAALSTILLRFRIGDTFNGEDINYAPLYNKSDGPIKDLFESAKQKLSELEITQALELVWAILLGDSGLIDSISQILRPLYPNIATAITEIRKLVQKAALAVGSIGPNPGPLIESFVSAVTVNLTEKKKVLLVSHSQGNFFANSVYDRIAPGLQTASLAVVHVATPTASVRGAYTTSTTDLVIAAVPTALPADISVGLTSADWLGHGFNEIYMNPSLAALEKIRSDINAALGRLVAPTQGGQPGFFTVTLTWDGEGDVDLHVIEPNGSHVYYSNKQGTSGHLDLDNTTANGPEHYYASCDSTQLQTGIYQVGINNYARATGRTATVALATQDRIYEAITLGVGEELGSSGNSSPISVLTVQVVADSQGRLKASLASSRSATSSSRRISTYARPNDAKR